MSRGGQHPEWDEELRFTILEDADDILARTQSASDGLTASTSSASSLSRIDSPGVTTAQALATKSRKGPLGKKGGKSMRLACYADDAKEPELIGECAVSIDDVLKLGEVDEWYDILYKEKYSGEVYLELTFFSNVGLLRCQLAQADVRTLHLSREMCPGHRCTIMAEQESSMPDPRRCLLIIDYLAESARQEAYLA